MVCRVSEGSLTLPAIRSVSRYHFLVEIDNPIRVHRGRDRSGHLWSNKKAAGNAFQRPSRPSPEKPDLISGGWEMGQFDP